MEKRLLFLFLIISKLDLKNKLEKFYTNLSNRKILQKYIYIFQEIFYKQSLSYSYNLYIYGPYSPSLTKDLIELHNGESGYGNLAKQYKLGDEITKTIIKMQQFVAEKAAYASDLDDISWLELISTYHYLYEKTYLKYSDRNEKCKEYIESNKPHLATHIDKVHEFLSNHTLLS
jgi:uncharacterized protein YwgA